MFRSTPVIRVGGDIVLGLMRAPVAIDQTDAVFEVKQGVTNRLDLISNHFYQTPELWWVIALVNNLFDPMAGFEVGTKIRVPTRERLASEGILTE